MANLILDEFTRYIVLIQVTDSTMAECVTPASRDSQPFANRLEHLPHDVVIFECCTVPRLEDAAFGSPAKMFLEYFDRGVFDGTENDVKEEIRKAAAVRTGSDAWRMKLTLDSGWSSGVKIPLPILEEDQKHKDAFDRIANWMGSGYPPRRPEKVYDDLALFTDEEFADFRSTIAKARVSILHLAVADTLCRTTSVQHRNFLQESFLILWIGSGAKRSHLTDGLAIRRRVE